MSNRILAWGTSYISFPLVAHAVHVVELNVLNESCNRNDLTNRKKDERRRIRITRCWPVQQSDSRRTQGLWAVGLLKQDYQILRQQKGELKTRTGIELGPRSDPSCLGRDEGS